MATGSVRLLGAILASTTVVMLVLITLLVLYVIRSCSKRRHQTTIATTVICVESADTGAVTHGQSPSNDVTTTYSAISRSTSDLLELAAAGSFAVQGPGGKMRQRLKSIGCLWPRPQGGGDSPTPLPVLDFDRLSAPMFARRSSLQPVLGAIRSDLYRQKTTDSVDSAGSDVMSCGQLVFRLKYSLDTQKLLVTVLRASSLPPKDAAGTPQDVGIKCYMLPDKKKKFQTKVARKATSPEFNEEFAFNTTFTELAQRSLQFVVFGFDRFSRQKTIGLVVVSNLVDQFEYSWVTQCCRDIISLEQAPEELGEMLLSLCYLPAAGRLTVTVIKARNLKAMDFTGQADPYVKVELLQEGKRVKKKKTKIAWNNLNPVYNEEIVFDVLAPSIHDVTVHVQVLDYDRIGSNEPMGSCWFGSQAPEAGRCHWQQMLDAVRKPVAQWHRLSDTGTVDKLLRRMSTVTDPASVAVSTALTSPTPSASPIPSAGPLHTAGRLSVDVPGTTGFNYSSLAEKRRSNSVAYPPHSIR